MTYIYAWRKIRLSGKIISFRCGKKPLLMRYLIWIINYNPMNNQIPTDLFWIRTVRYELDLYSEAMSLFCGIILYHIDSFGESFSTALKDDLVKTVLSTLTVCIHNTNPLPLKKMSLHQSAQPSITTSRTMAPLSSNSLSIFPMSVLRRSSVTPS